MTTSQPLDILLKHNRWATNNLLDACAALEAEAFHRPFEMGVGSLHDTITHILGAMRGWTDLLAGRDQRPRLEEDGRRSIDELRSLLHEIADEMESLAAAHPVDEDASGERGGRTYTFKRGAVLTHVTTHGMHHRAQCLNMLRQIGAESLPPSAVIEWVMMTDE